MHIRIHNLRIKILLGFLLSCFAMQAQVAVPFTIRYQDNIKGDITQISNSIVNRHQDSFSQWEKHNGVWNYVTYPELFPENAYPQSWESTNNNDNYDMEYIDIDSDASTFSSSSATLSAITDVSCSTVVYAALYWSATYKYNTDDSTSGRATDFNQIKLKLPGSATYTDINGTTIYDGYGTTDFNSNSPYVCYADITALVAGLANPNGTYTAANIRASEADLSGGVSGGWTIFIVYENPNMPGKYVTSYDGFAGVKSSLASIDVNYTGFTTVPAPLPVRAKLMACALEGDKGISGDQLLLKDASAATFTQLSNGLNPATNFFNGSITYLDASNVAQSFTARVPNSSNTLGYDADIININQGLIANSSTGATLRITSTQDTYFLFFNSLAVDIIEPEIQLIKTVEDLAGNDIGGADVNLGDYLEYVISFQNLGNDDATSFTITDLLPNNTYFNQVDVTGAPGVTYVYNPGTEEVTFTIPDNLVEEDDPAYEIRLRVRVAESCNDLKDACSNIIQNSAYATYQGILNSNVISNDPSIAGLNGCGQPVTGPANFLVDIDDCNFQRTVTLCSGPVTVTASDGYTTYTWYDSNNVEIGNTQSIDLTEGDYYVVCVAPAPCVSITEYVTVNNFSDLNPNPVIPFADELAICANYGDGSEPIPNIFLCGIDDERLIQTGITDATSISWQKLNEGDCVASCPTCDDLPDDCPWTGCPNSTWGVVGTGQDFVADSAGKYRLVVMYDGCPATYYFNVFKNNLDPQFTKENIICTADGNITVTNVPAGYEYQLVNQTTNTVIYDYTDGMGPSFDITASGIYTVNIRQQGVDTTPGNTYCEFSLEDIGIQNRTLSVNVITEDATCNGLGSIRLQALNVGPQYYFSITGPSSDSHGPVMDNNHLFDNLNPGTYTYTVTTDDGCSVTGTATIIDQSNLSLIASVSQNISCTQGNIQMNASGGNTPYIYAIYSYNGVLQNPTPGDYQTSVIFDVQIGDQGDYVFIVKDGNGCTSLSNEVTITLVPDVAYTTAVNMVSCNGADNGSIIYTLGNTQGYNVSFDLFDASNNPIGANSSGSFTGLPPGDYTVILHQTKGNRACDFPFSFTITEPDSITGGTASVTQSYDCTVAGSSGATITVDPATLVGGTAPYQYSVDGVNFTSSTTFTGLTAGTYNVTVKDANGCTYVINSIVIDPLTPPTDLTFSATPQTCPALTSDVTLTVISGAGPFTYQITAPAAAVANNGTNNVFAGLSAGTYTFMVTDSKGCTYSENYTINALTPIAVNGQPVSNVTCFGAADGSLNFNVSGFSTNYQYTIVNGASATVASSASATAATIPLTGLAAETYTITVIDNVTNCNATATVTISGPASTLTITTTSNPITCVANGSVSVSASGGWGSYQYTLTQPDLSTVGPQSGSSFTGLTQAGTYTVTVRDANNCTVTDTFTLSTPVPPTASLTGSDICYDSNGASLTVTVTGGTAPFTYSLNGAPGQSSNVFSNLTPNTYNITVTDAYGCTATVSQTIAPTLTAMAAFTKGLDCTLSPDAQIDVTINGGTSPYTYEVSADGGTNYGASASVTGSSISYQTAVDGSFRFRITDANGCVTETNTTVIAPLTLPSITSVSQTQNILCNGESTGALSVVIDTTTGTGPFTINVYNTTTSTDYGTQTTGLPAGNYTVTVTDANSCTDSQTNVIITEPTAVAFDTTEVPITCDPLGTGVSAGEIIIENVTGGTTPFTYYLSNNFGYADSFTATTNEDHSFAILDYGIYQVTVVDANGCTLIEQDIVMASPPEDMDIDISTLTTDCTNGGTAVVTVNPDVSSNDYSFAVLTTENDPANIPAGDWQPADSGTPLTSTFTGLIPGVTYTFVVRDNVTGCYYVKAADQPVNTPSSLTSVIDVINNVSCKGSADGNVDVTIDNFDAGTTQVNYEVYYAQSNQPTGVTGSTPVTAGTPATITGIGPLAPGTYFILFTEVDGANAGCSAASGQFSITESPEVLTVTASVVSNANCNANSGVITAVADGGTASYQYLILAAPVVTPPTAATAGWTTSNTFNVDGGDYMVYVMDAYGCIQPIAAPITLDTDPSPVIALSVVQQCGVAEGSYSVQVDLTTAGMPPYTYSFNGGAFQAQSGTTFTYTNLVSGTYNVTVRDVNGCTDTQTITVYPPLNLTPAVTAQPTCAGSDGVITVTATGGSSNYEYELQDTSNNPIVAANPSNVFAGQDPGDYIVEITDTTTGCSVTAPVTLEAPTPVTFTYVSQNVSCNGANDGSIVVTLPASNNNPVYTYTLDDGTNPAVVQNSNIFTGLAVGTYTLTVTSGKNCTAQEIINITEPNALTLTATATDFACDVTNAVTTSTITAIVGASTGTAPYTYSIDGTNFFTSNTFEVVDNGTTQNITVTVKDANNCTATFPLTINPLPEIISVVPTLQTAITCTNDETVTITVTGGSGDFTFDLLPLGTQASVTPGVGIFTADFVLTAPGSYDFQVTDNVTGCYEITTAPYTIAPYDTIEVEATASTQVTCFGDANGTVTIEVTGYTGAYDYVVTDALSNTVATGSGATTTNPFTITGLTAGNLNVTITATDSPFCSAVSNNITVASPADPLVLNAAETANVTCTNDQGEILATATGGWGSYEFELINNTSATTVQPYGTNNAFTGLAGGSYTVNVRDAGGCIVSQTIDLIQPAPISATINASATLLLCNGDNTATVDVTGVTGGEGVYQYILNIYDDAGTTIVISTDAQTSPTFDNLGAGTYSITVTDGWSCDLTTPTVTIDEPDPIQAFLNLTDTLTCTTQAEITVSATGGTPTYQYSLDGVTYTNQTVYAVGAGTYQIYVRDSNNCTAVLSNEVTVLPVPPLTINLDLSSAVINCFGESTASIVANVTGGLGNYSYELLDGTSALIAGPQPENTFSGLPAGDYYVRVTSDDCEETSPAINIVAPPAFDASVSKQDILCWDQINGVITVTVDPASPGTGNVQYAISPNLNQFVDTNVFTGLAAGWYDVIAQDQNGCFEMFQVEIIEPAKLEAQVTSFSDEVCYNEGDGTITVEITGGVGNYEVSMDNTTWYPVTGTTYTFTGITIPVDLANPDDAVMFLIYVKDGNDCNLTPPIEHWVLPPVDLQPSAAIVYNCTNNVPGNEVTISVDSDLTLDLADLTYSVDGGAYQVSNIFNNLSVGSHTVDVAHINGCIKSVTFTIDLHEPIVIDSAVVTSAIECFGDATGEITVTASGGTGILQYGISTSATGPFTYGTANVFTDLATGTYYVSVTDEITCEITSIGIFVDEPTQLTASVTGGVTDEICLDAEDGTVTITVSGGTLPYFTSIDSDADADFTQDQLVYTGLAAGNHTVYVKDANGCTIVAPLDFTVNPGVDIQANAEVLPFCTNNVPEIAVLIGTNSNLSAADLEYSLDGVNYQASNAFTGLAAGNYTAYVRHTNGCVDTDDFVIDTLVPISIDATPITTPIACFGGATGVITVTASGGTGDLSYAISTDPAGPFTYGASNVFNGLATGTYYVSVMDEISCEITSSGIFVDEPTELTASVTGGITNEICFTNADGTVTVTVSGGTTPYYTSLDSNNPGDFAQDVFTYTGLAAGTHTLYVKDANNCIIASPITFDIEPGVDMVPDAVVVENCANNVPGNEVTINVTSSQTLDPAELTYSVDGTNYQASNVFNNLAPGNYTAYVQHTNGCIETDTFTINVRQPISIDAATVTTPIACFGGTTGVITVTASGGTGALQYGISTNATGPFTYGGGNVFNNLATGTYYVSVTDTIGCEITSTGIFVGEPTELIASVTGGITNEICFTDADGTVTVTVSGGTAPYFTSLDSNNPADFAQDVFTYTGLAAGTHTLYVKDFNNCTIASPITFDILPGVDMTPTATVVENCTNNVPGNEVTIDVASSQTLDPADLTYSVDGTTYQASNVFNNLAPGNYTAYVQHANGCIKTDTFTINTLQPITIDSAVVTADVLCFGEATGVITVTASGGTGTLQYAISPAFVYGSTNVFTGLTAGTYTVRVTDGIGCEVETSTLEIMEPTAPLSASVGSLTHEICFNAADGTITLTIAGGTAPYFTSLDSNNAADFAQDVLTYSGIAAGDHTVYVKDANDCTVTPIDFTINEGVDMTPTADIVATCSNNVPGNTVTINVASSQTLNASDIQYSLDGTNYQASNVFTNMAPATYTVYVRHTNGCVQTVNFTIDPLQPVSASVSSIVDVPCKGDATGSIEVTATGGTGALEYAISPAFVYGSSNVFTDLATGSYTIRVRDSIGCEVEINSITVDEPLNALTSTIDVITDEICLNAADGTVTITVSGGTAPYFTSLDSNNDADYAQDVFTYTGLTAGTHTVFVKDANDCTIATPLVFDIEQGVDIQASAEVLPLCTNNVPGNVVIVNVSTNVLADVVYSLDGINYQTDNFFTDLTPGNYTAYVRHNNGCVDTDDFVIDNLLPISIDATPITSAIACFGDATGEITVTASGGTGALTYAISTDPGNYTPNNVFTDLPAGTYTVSVMDEIGCEVTSSAIVVDEPAQLTASVAGGITNEICFNAADGTVTVTVSGGTAPYFTSLDSAAFVQDMFTYTGLAAGTHTIDVHDVNNCVITATLTFTIEPGADMTPSATVVDNCTNNVPGNEVTIDVASSQTLDPADLTYSVDGTTYQASNVFNNLAPGNYTAYVQHANGCIETTTFTINTLQPIAATAVATLDVLCKGQSTGEITVTASGGTGTLQYAISPAYVYGPSNVFTDLPAGTYTVRVTDGIGCEFEVASVTVDEPVDALTSAIDVITDEICFNAADGTVTITVSGGTAPYFTSLDSNNAADYAQDVFTYTGLTAGTHTVFVKDANDCTIATPLVFDILPGADMTPSATVVDNCTNNVPGNEVTIDVASSQTLDPADLTYSVDGTTYQTSNVFNNLAPGNYTAYVQHANGCIETTTFTINTLQPIAATAVATLDVLCKGQSTGEITVTATGGTGTLQYAISPAYVYGPSNVFTDLPAGTYTVRVTDGIGCEFEVASVTVDEPVDALTSAIDVITDEICFNAADGTVTITVSGGTAPYFTSLDSNNDADYAQDVFTYTGLTAGTHTVFVKDANDCTIATPLVFDILPGADMTPSATVVDNCTNNVPGNEVTIDVASSQTLDPADLTYSVDGTTYQTSNVFNNLAPGNYTAYVQHANGCIETTTFTINTLQPIAATAVATLDVLCKGQSTGEITVTATGGTGTLQYAISPAYVYGPSNVFTDLPAGTYTVRVTDGIGCEFEVASVTVDEPVDALTSAIDVITDEICFNAADGTVTITVSGGTAPYFTSLDSNNDADYAQDVFTYTGLTAGTHTVFVKDANDCTIATPLVFDIEQGVDIQASAEVLPLCTNNVPGNVVIVNVNPNVLADVQYSLDGVNYQTDNFFTDLTPGNYTAYVQHTNGCVQTTPFTINALQPISIDSAAVTANVLCFGEATGEITVVASGGTGALTYAISTDPGNYTANNVFTNLPAGTYTVSVMDEIGCEITTANLTVNEPSAALTAAEVVTDEICFNANDGTITLTVSGGTAPYFTSLDSNNPADFVQDQFVYTNIAVGSHTIYVTDSNGCTITPIDFTINPGADMTPSATVVDNCTNNVPGNEVTIDVASSQTLDPADLTYSVDGTTYQASNVFNNLAPGNYTAYVQHANGCIETTTFTINTLQPIAATAVATLDVLCKGQSTGEITVTATGGTGTLQYAISPAYVYGPSNVFTDLPAGTYTVRVTDGIGCEFEVASVTVDEPVDALTFAIDVITDEICFNAADGTVTITVSGGTAPYFTSLDSNNDADYAQDVFTYTGLTAGTHTVFVKDANDCTIATPLVFDILPGADMTPSATVVDNCTNNVPGNEVTIDVASSQTLDPADLTYSVDGTTYQASNVFNNLAPGNYTAYVQHANGCIETTTFTINTLQPITIDAAAVTADVLCFGEATGEITVTASGGTGTLQYAISPDFIYGTNNVFTGLTAGSYTVMVTDGIGCELQSATLTITEPTTALTMSNVVTTDEICFNATDGTVTFTVNGGTAPYFTSLDSNNPADFIQDVFNYTGLTAGDHTVYVIDSNGCEITPVDFTIAPGADMTPSATVVDNCTNNVPGNEVTIDVASSQTLDPADITYSVDGTTYQASNVFNNLAPGNYTAYVQHANGCIETTTFTINTLQPITIDAAAVTADVLCFGETTGEITVTASGGTGTLQYAISPDFVYGTNNVFTGLTAGSYTVMVTDGIGCEVQSATLTITEPTTALVTGNVVKTDETCFNDADGTVTFTVSGGTAPYFTSLDSNNPADFVQDVFNYTGLTAGNHTVYVMDSNGCTVTPITFNVAPGVNTQPTVNVQDICNNNTPGNIVTISIASQYVGQVQYSVDGVTYQASNIYNNLTAGTYTAYVQHVNGCIQTVDFDVEDHQPVNATATVTQNVICFGDDTGEILVTATGGTGQLEYAISPVFTYTTNNTFTSLVAGTYTIKVKDELGCVQTINNVVITQAQSQIAASVNWTNETCLNANDGTVTISVSGGTAPYSTSMDGVTFVQDQFTYSNLGGGQHIVFVQDAAGCSIIPIVFNVQDGVTFNPVLTSEQICNNNTPLHMITVQNINANIAGDIMYSIDGVNYQSSNIFTNLPAGTYTVYIRHTNGCIKTREITLQNSKPILGLLTVRDALCNGEANGVIMVDGSGGVGQLTYGISPDFVMTTESTFNVPAGTYTVRVQDETGCYMEYTATIGEPTALILTEVEVYPEVCENDDNGAILIDITGGTAPYSTSMDMNQPFEVDKNLYTNLDGGVTYTIYVKDANGCVASIDVWMDAPLTINATPELVYNCDENILTVNVESGVQGQVTYSLNGGTPQTSNVFTNLADGTYVVDVLHESGCIDSTDPVTVENTTPLVLILAETDLNEITATTTGGSGGYTYTFNNDYMGSTNVFEIYATGTYVVTVTDSRGCVAQKTISAEFVDITLPDVMSPNDDGINDTWAPGNTQNYPNLEFYVFDRYGRKLATLRQGQEWDGKYNGNELPTGDYWYIVKLNNPGDDREFVGHFTIFR